MSWNKKYTNTRKPFQANYNRSYDTHTEHGSNQSFASNPPAYADDGPDEYSGTGTEQNRKYSNPTNVATNGDGSNEFLGMHIGPREIQTGNAPSGGYSTRPGLGFAAGTNDVAYPDYRRTHPSNHSDEWYTNQADINRKAIGGEVDYRRGEVRITERLANIDKVPSLYDNGTPPINAIEDSPYRKDWPEPNRLTMRTNPQKFWFRKDWDRSAEYRTSGARFLNGSHYSMAQHNSLTPYENQYQGGAPVRFLRNTYRLDPAPYDVTNTDSPSNTPDYNMYTAMDQPGAYGTAYRL